MSRKAGIETILNRLCPAYLVFAPDRKAYQDALKEWRAALPEWRKQLETLTVEELADILREDHCPECGQEIREAEGE